MILRMTNSENAVLADVIEFVTVGGAVVEFCPTNAFPAVQVVALVSLLYWLRLRMHEVRQVTYLVLV